MQLEHVGVRYGKNWALQGVDLDIWRGDILAFIGPNGAGKSSLLRAILGLVPLAEGRIVLDSHSAPLRIGYVPQRLDFDTSFPITVSEFLTLNLPQQPLWTRGLKQHQRHLKRQALARLQCEHVFEQKLGALSGGQFQRVLLAAALLREPELLLLDEPASNIDRRGSEDLHQLLLQLHADLGLTLIFVSHDVHFVSHLATRVGCLNQSFCGLGPPSEILCEHFLAETYGSAFQPRQTHF